MGLFSFGNKDDAPPTRRRGSQARAERGEPRRRRTGRGGDAAARDTAFGAGAMLLDPTLPEKQRARRRLVGAIALVIAAIVVLPLVLDSHPKPVTDDIAIDIPSRPANLPIRTSDDGAAVLAGVAPDSASAAVAGVTPLAAPAQRGVAAPLATPASSTTTSLSSVKKAQSATPKTEKATRLTGSAQRDTAAPPVTSANTPAVAQASPSPMTRSRVQNQQAVGTDRASTMSGGGASDAGTPAAPPGARFALELGVFSDDANARKWESKLKAAGVPVYIENRKQADGTRRVSLRAGPFPDRAAASAAIAKVREAGLTSDAQ
ncbi:MAG TPA: SPOR domain-containing protein [Trinickia sp.]|uniref:SPOR domain-containing protein n=1 Tax=Trinickia sp. TaxID=2571163 RepID=UPI002CCC2B22|nr:SPOR domain-containing protein [Trinickia sp.]HTI16540.1 SPOR domain-containing protein [Trinickia sp.]